MSGVVISYGRGLRNGLEDASREAKNVSQKLADYSDALNDDVFKKLNNYAGERNENFNTALNCLRDKISQLDEDSDKYTTFSADIDALKDACIRVDEEVASRVDSLTGEFKTRNEITTNKMMETLNLFLTKVKNSTFIGRWIDDVADWLGDVGDYFKECIEDWYQFQGGKEFVKGMTVAALELVIAVAGIIAAAAGGWSIMAVVGILGGVIAGVNAITNMVNEFRAYAQYADDPAKARRTSGQNSLQDTMRAESHDNIAFWDTFAGALDVLEIACAVMSFGDGIIKGVKNWKGSNGIWKTIKNGAGNAWGEMRNAIRMKDFTNIKTAMWTNIAENFQKDFLDFSDLKKSATSTKTWASQAKDIFTVTDDILSGDFSVDDAFSIATDITSRFSIGKYTDGNSERNTVKLSAMIKYPIDLHGIGTSGLDFAKSGAENYVKIDIPQNIMPDINVNVDLNMPDMRIDCTGLRSTLSFA